MTGHQWGARLNGVVQCQRCRVESKNSLGPLRAVAFRTGPRGRWGVRMLECGERGVSPAPRKPTSQVRAVLNRLARVLRERASWERAVYPDKATGLDAARNEVLIEIRKLDLPKKRATKKAARKTR